MNTISSEGNPAQFCLESVKKTDHEHFQTICCCHQILTRQKVLKVAKMKDANYGCKDEGNEVSH